MANTIFKVIAAFVLLLCVVFYHLLLVFGNHEMSKYSYPYFVLLDELTRTIPIIERHSDLKYYSYFQDNMTPQREGLTYTTTATPDVVLNTYKDFFSKKGYAIYPKQCETTSKLIKCQVGHRKILHISSTTNNLVRVYIEFSKFY